MPQATGRFDAARAVVFAPLDPTGRAELVAQRLTDAIVSGVLRNGERLPSESELSRSLGVALVTAREALEMLRDQGLVLTRRGREGGSFVTFDRESASHVHSDRLRTISRIELRDLALHVSAIAGMAAEAAADRASDDDVATLRRISEAADLTTAGGARRATTRFQLEVAAVSQSPRLVREEVRLQGEAGPLLWLCLREQEYRDRGARSRERVIAAIADADAETARTLTVAHIDSAFRWLIVERSRLGHPLGAEPASATSTREGTS
ncbi:winged helix-turn-helix domain-containing protein [Microbacter sp. GSS18]|nr:winged helix-turn-helix domain-containing protein [Microbacter sp. GSS18]